MKQECVDTLQRAAGRALTIAEKRNIEKRIIDARQQLYDKDPDAFMGMTQGQKLQESGKIAAENLKIEAAKRQLQIASTIAAHDRAAKFMDKGAAAKLSRLETLRRYIGQEANKGGVSSESMETRIKANQRRFQSMNADAFRSTGRKFLNMFGNEMGDKAFRYEVAGIDSKTIDGVTPEMAAKAKAGAEAWNKTSETMRTLRNKLGGSTGKLENYIPQDHSQLRVAQAGANKWGNFILPLLDRRRYLNSAGDIMNDTELERLFKGKLEDGVYKDGIHSTIATGGADDLDPGKFKGRKMLANRAAESRVINFKDVDSQIAYDKEYGGSPLYDKLVHHVDSMAKDIGTLEHFGANPDLQFKYWVEDALKKDTLADPENAKQIKSDADRLQSFYTYMSGKGTPIVNQTIARMAENTRDFIAGVKLPMAPLTVLNHLTTSFMTAKYNGLPMFQLLRNMGHVGNVFDRTEEGQAQRLGLSLETLLGNTNKWAGDKFGGSTFIKYASNGLIRSSGLNAIIEGMRRSFGVTMYGSIGKMVSKIDSLDQIEGASRRMLDNKGVTPEDWQVWKQAQQEDWGGGNSNMIVPENIFQIPDEAITHLGNPATLRQNAAMRLIGMVDEEAHNAVISTTNWEQFKAQEGKVKGKVMDELYQSFNMFKSIPIAQIARNFDRMISLPTGAGRAAYGAGYLATGLFVSGMIVQLKELAAGRDPENMLTSKFWADCLTKGGLFGMYGDLLFNQQADSGLERFAGPLYNEVKDLYTLTAGNAAKAITGKKTSVGADALRFAYNNMPLKNWYDKAFLDRNIFNNLMQMINPGYMQRVQQRARAAGQSNYWQPNEALPSRLPNLSNAIGQP